jgi:periplasmic divalent cation tolerance protein
MTDVLLVLTTVPDGEMGELLARTLVEERLAACVSVLAPMVSFYRWRGAIERALEHQVIIKTTRERLAAVQARVRQLHSYDLPELLVLTIDEGGAEYLEWVGTETAAS